MTATRDWTDVEQAPRRSVRKGDQVRIEGLRRGWWKVLRIEVSGSDDRCNVEVQQLTGAGHSRIFPVDRVTACRRPPKSGSRQS